MSLKIPEHLVVAIFREDVRCRDEPPHGLDLDHLPEGPPHEQRLQEGQHGRRDRQPHVRRHPTSCRHDGEDDLFNSRSIYPLPDVLSLV